MGEKIRVLRRRGNLTQRQVADLVGITAPQMHRYETGATRIATSRLVAIATALGVGADSLVASLAVTSLPRAPPVSDGTEDIRKLVTLFALIADPAHRGAVLALAKSLSRVTPAAPDKKLDR